MFANLIESASHTRDIRRRSSFFFGTLIIYTVLLLVAGVASVYAYKTKLEKQDVEFVTLLPPVPIEPAPRTLPRQMPTNNEKNYATRRTLMESNANPTKTPDTISTKSSDVKPVNPYVPTTLKDYDSDPISTTDLPNGSKIGVGEPGNRQIVSDDSLKVESPKREPPKVEKPKQQPINLSNSITGKAIYKFQPPYPSLAKQTHVAGAVTVNIVVDETGKVVSARAASGHPFLAPAAQQAAYQWRFSPTMLNSQPVKVSGVITFNFILE